MRLRAWLRLAWWLVSLPVRWLNGEWLDWREGKLLFWKATRTNASEATKKHSRVVVRKRGVRQVAVIRRRRGGKHAK